MIPSPPFLALYAGLLVLLAVVSYQLGRRRLARRTEELEAAYTDCEQQLQSQRAEATARQEQFERAQGNLQAILDQIRVGFCLIDGGGRIEFLNDAAERVLGCSTVEAKGKRWQELLPLTAEDTERAEALLATPAPQRTRIPARLDITDGRRYWIELDIRDDPRDAARHILYLHDVTELFDLQGLVAGAAQFQGMIGETAVMRAVFRQIRDVAAVDSTVVLEGETGTGKELAARAIHDLSPRKNRPYVTVNCAGLTESLLSSQLFGHRRGAFTAPSAIRSGCSRQRRGARCCSTRWETSRSASRPTCCVSSRPARSLAWASRDRARSTCG